MASEKKQWVVLQVTASEKKRIRAAAKRRKLSMAALMRGAILKAA